MASVETLLLPSAYRGASYEDTITANALYTYKTLEEVVQASSHELAAECSRLGCVELGGSCAINWKYN